MKSYDNKKCHTLHRIGCYDNNLNDIYNRLKEIDEYHLYYGSVKCANKVISGDFYKLSFFAIAMFALLF